MLGSGNNLSRGAVGLSSDTPNLSQVLTLEPIRLANPNYTHLGELRKVLGFPSREDGSFGMSHPKPYPPVATEELRHFKERVQNTSRQAGDLAKKLSESIFKLDKYAETLSSKKRRRNDMSPGERIDAANFDKVRNQVPGTQDSVAQRSDERKKMFRLNKRVRTPVGDGDGRVSNPARQQVIERESDSHPSVSGETVGLEEKIRRLPVGGEGWETRMKRKRSVATLGSRVMNPDQRVMQPKPKVDSKLRSCDTQNFRLKSSTGVGGINRLESSFEPDSPSMSGLSRNELETVTLARDRSVIAEQRLMAKGNNKRNLQGDSPTNSSTAILKGNVSRAPRTATVMGVDSSSKVESPSGVLQGSSTHAMAQWVGQRPKNSRTRRTNVVSPVNKHSESKSSAQGFAASDFSPRASPGPAGSPLSVVDSPLKRKRELKNASSPYGLSESEESGAGDNKIREHARESGDLFTTPKTRSPSFPARKNKIQTSHKGGGAWKLGKGESVPSLTTSGYPMMVKSENVTLEKPLHNVKIASDKNRSKYGRPPAKKVKDRKPSMRRASNLISTPDITGESDDDREDIFAAANSARKAANLACSGKFWKKMDHIFAATNSDDMQNIKEQLNFAEELDESLSEAILDGYNIMGIKLPKAPHRPGEGIVDYSGSVLSCISDLSFERLDMTKLNESNPLFKRVLSALIEEDDGEEVIQFNGGKNLSLHYASDDSHSGSCTYIDTDFRERDRMELETESSGDFQTPKSCLFDRFSSERSVVSNPFRNGSMSTSVHSNEQWIGDDDISHSDAALGGETYSNSLSQFQAREVNIPNFPVSDTQYQLMSLDERLLLELQSIGVFPEAMPDLAEETMSTDVMELKEGIYQQVRNKKKKLEKLNITIQKGKDVEKRKIEQIAMDQLVETAHKKIMASRGNKALKAHKVTRPVAMAFIKRTLARCRKFDETGLSCFADPALQDILFSSPSNDAKSSENGGSGTASNTLNEPSNHQAEAKGSGAVSSTKRREALVDDVIGCASSKVTTSIDSAVLSGGGKRNEREDGFRNKNKPKPKENKNENQSRSTTTTTHPTGPASRGRGGGCGDGAVDEEAPIDFSKLAFHDLEEIDEQADIGNWFEGLQDIDTAGLDEVPMDDLSFLFG